MRALLPLSLGLLVLNTACDGNSFSGSFDGESPGAARGAVFDELEISIPILGTYRAIVVLVTGIDQPCEAFQAVNDTNFISCDEACEDLTVVADEYLGQDEYLNMWLTFRADSQSEGDYTLDTSFEEGEFLASAERWDVSNLYDAQTCESACQDGGGIETSSEAGESGTASLRSYASNSEADGSFDVDFGGGDAVSGRFRAEPCDLGDWIWWL